ncbi:hypothetical protein M8A51_18365 [Schlegelella sp. S2-27]|uniref:Uncharacterized protein n=1 Tax=Caldimonas mangrovi TaxID=2944811 RepID=A0ABT0YRX6_9BURK|nr:hypothetical protein [Caldimonas mangrovi]MCM5681495.1 hypothetical protein [Caldimonas mangrovi]
MGEAGGELTCGRIAASGRTTLSPVLTARWELPRQICRTARVALQRDIGLSIAKDVTAIFGCVLARDGTARLSVQRRPIAEPPEAGARPAPSNHARRTRCLCMLQRTRIPLGPTGTFTHAQAVTVDMNKVEDFVEQV